MQRLVERTPRHAQGRGRDRGSEHVQRAHRDLEALAGLADALLDVGIDGRARGKSELRGRPVGEHRTAARAHQHPFHRQLIQILADRHFRHFAEAAEFDDRGRRVIA